MVEEIKQNEDGGKESNVENETKAVDQMTQTIAKLKNEIEKLKKENQTKTMELKEHNPRENEETETLKEIFCIFILFNFFIYSTGGGRINMNNVKKDFIKIREENENMTKVFSELTDRNSNIFKKLREETKEVIHQKLR